MVMPTRRGATRSCNYRTTTDDSELRTNNSRQLRFELYIAYYICELVSFFTERSFDFVVVIDVVKHNHAKAPMFRSFVDLFYKKSMFLVS